MSFKDELQPASFRGVPFAVLTAEGRFGRRQAVHEYPFRDTPWIEDMGRATRKISFVAFLVSDSLVYDADPDVIAQREALIAACETLGPGTLVHPTLGRLTVSCIEDGCVITERWDEWRYFEVGFTFLESGTRQFPAAVNDTGSVSDANADAMDIAAGTDYGIAWAGVVNQGQAVIGQTLATAELFRDQVSASVLNATGLFTMLAILPGNFGRYFGGGTSGFAGQTPPPAGSPTTVDGLVDAGAADRAEVTVALTALTTAAQGTDPNAVAVAAQGAMSAFLTAMVDPAVAISLLVPLANFFPDAPTTDSIIGLAMAAIQTAAGALLRRAVFACLVRACALYQPTSRDDAANLRDQVAALLDDEILVAGDNGDDASYLALRNMRVAVVTDLNTRGAALSPMKVFNFPINLPALAIAQQLYQDSSRASELITEANPPHPAFMPLSFSALSQ